MIVAIEAYIPKSDYKGHENEMLNDDKEEVMTNQKVDETSGIFMTRI
jgi:hypothetical protein